MKRCMCSMAVAQEVRCEFGSCEPEFVFRYIYPHISSLHHCTHCTCATHLPEIPLAFTQPEIPRAFAPPHCHVLMSAVLRFKNNFLRYFRTAARWRYLSKSYGRVQWHCQCNFPIHGNGGRLAHENTAFFIKIKHDLIVTVRDRPCKA